MSLSEPAILAIGLALLFTLSLLDDLQPEIYFLRQRPGASSGTRVGLLLVPFAFATAGIPNGTNSFIIIDHLVYYAFINSFALVALYSRYRGTALFATIPIAIMVINLYLSSSIVWISYFISLVSVIVFFSALLNYFPLNFTSGEAMIISNLISLLLGDAVKLTLEINVNVASPFRIFLLALILGMIFIGISAYWPILIPLRSYSTVDNYPAGFAIRRIGYSLVFHAFAIFIVLLFISPWARTFLETEPFEWAFSYIFNDFSQERPILFLTWLIVIILGLIIASRLFSLPANSPMDLNLRRKYYHAMAVAIFLPGYLLDVSFI
jgi:dolichol kinase